MGVGNVIFNVAALAFSFGAILISAISAQRQTADARRANYILFVSELGQRYRSGDFRKAQDYISTELSKFDPVLGIYNLPDPARGYVLLVGGFYQDLGLLALTGALNEDIAVATYYSGIKEAWLALEPYIRGERETRRSRGAGSMWGSFEHIAVYVESVPFDKVTRKLHRRRRFPAVEVKPVAPVSSIAAGGGEANQPESSEAG
jgi:hypothetical protein